MKPTAFLIGVSFLILLNLSVSALAGGNSAELTIVYSSDIVGRIQPCPT